MSMLGAAGCVLVGLGTTATPAGTATESCVAGVCTLTFSVTGAPETWTVPGGVTSVRITAAGGAGGTSAFDQAGGAAGQSVADVPVAPGTSLSVVVGDVGADGSLSGSPVAPTFGGGGAGGVFDLGGDFWYGASGGGGSFVFGTRPDASVGLLVAVGGGGGGGASMPGGDGGATGAGATPLESPNASGGGATTTAGGVAGGGGAAGSGPATAATALGTGGDGEAGIYAGAGGGGYFGGGGGGFGPVGLFSFTTGAGGGGSGFLLAEAALVSSGGSTGAGSVVITYDEPPPGPSATTLVARQPDGDDVGDPVVLTATVTSDPSGGPTPTGTIHFFEGSAEVGGSGTAVDGSGVASVTLTDVTAGSHTYRAEYGGDASYVASTSTAATVVVDAAGPSTSTSTTSTTAPPGAVRGAGATSDGGPSTFARTGSDLRRAATGGLAALAAGTVLLAATHLPFRRHPVADPDVV
jgi:hypothetical protein